MSWYRPCRLDAVEEIVNAYNDSESDGQTDYYQAKFFAHVDMDCELKDLATSAAIEALSAKSGQVEMLELLGI